MITILHLLAGNRQYYLMFSLFRLKMMKRYQVKTLQHLDKNDNSQFENEMYSYYVLFDRRNERITSTEIVDPAEWEEYEN